MLKALIATVVAGAVAVVIVTTGLGGIVVLTVLLGGGAQASAAGSVGACAPTIAAPDGGDLGMSGEQQAVAETILRTGVGLGVPTKGLVVAIATGKQESQLRNLDDGLGSSVGVFQIIAENGTLEQRKDVEWSSTWFFTRLLAIPGWQDLSVWEAAQAVQRSGHPTAYAKWEDFAVGVVAAYTGDNLSVPGGCQSTAGDCPATTPAQEDGLVTNAVNILRCGVAEFGITSTIGWAANGHVQDSYHYKGQAVDFMLPVDGVTATPEGKAAGQKLATWALSNKAEFGVIEIIFYDHIWTQARAAEGWRPYRHPSCRGAIANCDGNIQHRNHVHVSVSDVPGTYVPGGGAATGSATLPVAAGLYRITATYNQYGEMWESKHHTGLDFAAPTGTPIVAVAAGTVTFAGWDGSYGWKTEITHGGGVVTWYGHQSAQLVHVGQQVGVGDLIGLVGQTGNVTGPHIHLEVWINKQRTDPRVWLIQHGVRP